MIYAGINLILSFVGIIGFNSYVKLMDIEKKLKGSHNTSNENDRLQGWISVQLSEKKMVINSIKGKEIQRRRINKEPEFILERIKPLKRPLREIKRERRWIENGIYKNKSWISLWI